jgi:hypothetical protein
MPLMQGLSLVDKTRSKPLQLPQYYRRVREMDTMEGIMKINNQRNKLTKTKLMRIRAKTQMMTR